MSVIETQIKLLYENQELSPDVIASALNITEGEVCYCLKRVSSVYNQKNKSLPSTQQTETKSLASFEDAVEMMEIMKDLAQRSDDDAVRLKAAQSVIAEAMGRNNSVKTNSDTMLSLTKLNEVIKQQNAYSAAFIQHIQKHSPIIDVLPASSENTLPIPEVAR